MKYLDVYVLITSYIREFGFWFFIFLATIGGAAGRNITDDKVKIPVKKLIYSSLLLSSVLFFGSDLLKMIPYVGPFVNQKSLKIMVAILWGYGSQEILVTWRRKKVWSFWDFLTRLKDKEKEDKTKKG